MPLVGRNAADFHRLLAWKSSNGRKTAVLKHPNTAWRLVVHEGGPDSKEQTAHQSLRIPRGEFEGNSQSVRIYFRT